LYNGYEQRKLIQINKNRENGVGTPKTWRWRQARNCIEIGVRDGSNNNVLISLVASEFDGFNEERKQNPHPYSPLSLPERIVIIQI